MKLRGSSQYQQKQQFLHVVTVGSDMYHEHSQTSDEVGFFEQLIYQKMGSQSISHEYVSRKKALIEALCDHFSGTIFQKNRLHQDHDTKQKIYQHEHL